MTRALGGWSDHEYVTLYAIDAPELQPVLDGLMTGFRQRSVTMSVTMSSGPIVVWEQLSSASA